MCVFDVFHVLRLLHTEYKSWSVYWLKVLHNVQHHVSPLHCLKLPGRQITLSQYSSTMTCSNALPKISQYVVIKYYPFKDTVTPSAIKIVSFSSAKCDLNETIWNHFTGAHVLLPQKPLNGFQQREGPK